MKRYAITAISLLCLVCLIVGVLAVIGKVRAMDVTFNKRDLPEHGVHIVTTVDPSFDGIAAEYFVNNAPEDLKPFSVFIKNSGSRLVWVTR